MPKAARTGIASRASRVTFSPLTASRWLSPARTKSSFVASSTPSSSPRTKPRASAASRAGMPSPSPASARSRSSPVREIATATRTAIPISTGRERRGVIALASRLQPFAQRFHRRRADPGDLVELVDRGEPAVFFAELDDVFGGHRADAVDRVQFGGRRGAEADRAVFFGARSAPGRPARRRDLVPGTTTCCPSASRAARFIESSSAFPSRPPPASPRRRPDSRPAAGRRLGPRTAPVTSTTTSPPSTEKVSSPSRFAADSPSDPYS